jgi:nucleotide-binding universal stress UspA family protein
MPRTEAAGNPPPVQAATEVEPGMEPQARRTILVPLDQSGLSERALVPAAAIAGQLGASLVLLTVPEIQGIDPAWYTPSMPDTEPLLSGSGALDEARMVAQTYLAARAQALEARGLEVDTALGQGAPADAIVDTAEARDAWLVVMATHGRGGLSRWAFGSVAEKVVQGLRPPLVLVRGDGALPETFRHVVVPLDGSGLAEAVLPFAAEIAGAFGARLTLLHAIRDPGPVPRPPALEEIEQEHTARMQHYLNKVATGLLDDGPAIGTEVLRGPDVDELLLERFGRGDVDLVGMTTHGRGGLGRWAFGSVADRLARAAPVPVLLARSRA